MADHIECLEDYGKGECSGTVQYMLAMSPAGKKYPRCDKHYAARLREQECIVSNYGGRMFY